MKKSAWKISILAMMTSLAMIFSYVENLVPVPVPVPGVKLGLANLVILLAMLLFGFKEAFIVGALRIFLSGLLFGNIFSLCLSASGFLISFTVMFILVRTKKFSIPGVSLAGGALHNIGQLSCAAVLLCSAGILRMAIWLAIIGMITGIINGFICKLIYERTKGYDWLSQRRID